MENNSLRELYIEELRDIYNAENQLVKALPKMVQAATSDQLRSGFEEHLEQTRKHVQRLDEITMRGLAFVPRDWHCSHST